MKKFKAKIYLKNKKELNEYLKNLVKIKKNPTLEDVKFSFKWGTIPCDQNNSGRRLCRIYYEKF